MSVVPLHAEEPQGVLFAPDREELAWAAGFFDGEGNIRARVDKYHNAFVVQIAQTDRRPLERFQAAVGGIGVIYGPYAPSSRKTKPHHNLAYAYHTNRFEHTQAVAAMLWSFLSPPKREQARSAVALFNTRPHRGPKEAMLWQM